MEYSRRGTDFEEPNRLLEPQAGATTGEPDEPLESALSRAHENRELNIFYQPKVEIRTGKVVGVEALLRWRHPERGEVSPADFIPAAERSDLILRIGEWVLREACAQTAAWNKSRQLPLVVSVNLSPRQFSTGQGIVVAVERALRDTGLSPRCLELEITEGMTMDFESALVTMNRLHALGVRIGMDDFGKGYSSLAYLKRFPLHTLKIDQAFIRECTTDESDATIVRTIISMAHNLKMKVVAEGVETKEQLHFLQEHLCDEVQGYLFAKALPPEELECRLQPMEGIVSRLGIGPDHAERIWLGAQLRNARQDLEETVRKQQGLIFKYKMQGKRFYYTLCDGELLYRFGFRPEQVEGKEVREVLTVEETRSVIGYYRKAWAGQDHVQFEAVISGVWCLTSLRPVRRGGRVVEVIGSSIDISLRKQAEEKLREVNAQYRLITENMTDLISVVDAEGVVLYASPSFRRILGYEPEEVKGFGSLHLLDPAAVPEIRKRFERAAIDHGEFRFETRFRHRAGHWVDMEVKSTPVMNEDGRIDRIVSVARDAKADCRK